MDQYPSQDPRSEYNIMSTIFPMLRTLVDLIFQFGEAVGHRLSSGLKDRPYQLVWTTSLLMIILGTCFQLIAALSGWTPGLYTWWYLLVIIMPTAFLGLGVISLVLP